MQTKYKTIAIASVIAVIASLVAFVPMDKVFASHSGEPTMWVNGINDGQTHSYIYMVPPGNLDMSVALLIKDMQEKPNVQLWTTNPVGIVTPCPPATVTAGGGPTNLLVAECFFSPPAPGLWTIHITAAGVMTNPLGYAIAADTTAPNPTP